MYGYFSENCSNIWLQLVGWYPNSMNSIHSWVLGVQMYWFEWLLVLTFGSEIFRVFTSDFDALFMFQMAIFGELKAKFWGSLNELKVYEGAMTYTPGTRLVSGQNTDRYLRTTKIAVRAEISSVLLPSQSRIDNSSNSIMFNQNSRRIYSFMTS